MTQEKELTVYQEAVIFRDRIKSGELSDEGYIAISSFLGLLCYMEIEADKQSIQLSDMAGHIAGMTCMMCNYLERSMCYDQKTRLRRERDILFSAHSSEMTRADIVESKILKDHEIAQLVNELTDIAKTYNGAEQLRGHISKCVVKQVKVGRASKRVKFMVDMQALDEGLWFDAQTAPEAYLQKKLRELHKAIEDD